MAASHLYTWVITVAGSYDTALVQGIEAIKAQAKARDSYIARLMGKSGLTTKKHCRKNTFTNCLEIHQVILSNYCRKITAMD